MKRYSIYLVWGALFIVCAGFGFIREPEGFLKAMLVLLSAGFFVPPVMLIYRGVKRGQKAPLLLVRNLSLLSLGATFVLLILNFMSVLMNKAMGDVLYWLLVVVSAPMVCGQYWAVSLFIWACLLFTCLHWLKKRKE